MADFENGLPPANTDLTGKKISDLSISADVLDDNGGVDAVQSISISQTQTETLNSDDIKSVSIMTDHSQALSQHQVSQIAIASEQVGRNSVMYM